MLKVLRSIFHFKPRERDLPSSLELRNTFASYEEEISRLRAMCIGEYRNRRDEVLPRLYEIKTWLQDSRSSGLDSEHDRLFPKERWTRFRLDRGMQYVEQLIASSERIIARGDTLRLAGNVVHSPITDPAESGSAR